MKRWNTKNGCEIIQVLHSRSNAYVILTGARKFLVDTGPAAARNCLFRNLDSLGAENSKTDALILTHTHFDHCQNAAAVKEREGCPVIIGEAEAKYTRRGFTLLPKGGNFYTRILSLLGNRFARKRFGYPPFSADFVIADDFFPEGAASMIRIIQTPGHSAGSMTVIVDDEIAIAGDTLFGVFKSSVNPPFADDKMALVQSWRRLLQTRCKIFLPGHGGAISRERLKSFCDKLGYA